MVHMCRDPCRATTLAHTYTPVITNEVWHARGIPPAAYQVLHLLFYSGRGAPSLAGGGGVTPSQGTPHPDLAQGVPHPRVHPHPDLAGGTLLGVTLVQD